MNNKDNSLRIVVLTPVKNEEWILDRFLSVTSQFADYIIVADQNSSDRSPEICKKHPKVRLIENNSKDFNEAERQLLLIKTARELVPEQKILLALDADEIIAANAVQTLGWKTMLTAAPGTVLYFEKQDLYPTPHHYVRYPALFPLGYVDDGAEHHPRLIHSTRIPTPNSAPRLYIHDVKILHYTWARPGNQAAKERMYSVRENIWNTKSFFNRRRAYNPHENHIKHSKIEPAPPEWFNNWEKAGIDMRTILAYKYYWHDFEVLRIFNEYGVKRFWLEPIWDFDWELCRLYAKSQGIKNIPSYSISKPPKAAILLLKFLDKLYLFLRKILR